MTNIQNTLNERGNRYGEFIDNARVAQEIKRAMRRGQLYDQLAPDQMEALDQIAAKISRIVSGDPTYDDNWRDISGYSTLVLDRMSTAGENLEY